MWVSYTAPQCYCNLLTFYGACILNRDINLLHECPNEHRLVVTMIELQNELTPLLQLYHGTYN